MQGILNKNKNKKINFKINKITKIRYNNNYNNTRLIRKYSKNNQN